MNEEEMLATLKASEIFAEDYPRLRPEGSAELSGEARRKWYEIIRNANVEVKNRWVLMDIVIQLGKSKYPPAVPVLIELWNTCVIDQIRTASGQALRENGTPEAHQVLKNGIDSTDYDKVERAVQIMFEENPMGSFDRFAEFFEPDRIQNSDRLRVQHATIKQFAPSGHFFIRRRKCYPRMV